MQDQVLMSPINGALCVGVPLYRRHDMTDNNFGYKIYFSAEEEKPVAYAIDFGAETLQLMNAEWIEENLEFLGDL